MSRAGRSPAGRSALALLAATCVVAAGGGAPARAHTTATGLADVTAKGTALTYRLTLVLAELPEEPARTFAAAADADAAAVERVVAVLRDKVKVRADGQACPAGRARLQGSRLADSRMTLEIAFHCPRPPGRLVLRDDWFDLFGD